MGGLSKKAYQFDLAKEKAGVEPLILDAGALLFKGNKLARGKEEQEKINAAGIVKSYNEMGYEGVGVTQNDLAAGLDFLLDMQKKSSFTWLSANMVYSKNSQPVFTSRIFHQEDGFRVAVTALTSLQASKIIKKEKQVSILPWQEVLPRLVEQLEDDSDMIILLSNLSTADNQAIARQYDSINIIMQAAISTVNLPPYKVNNTLLCQTTSRGKYIGIMNIDWQSSARWGAKTKEKIQKKKGDLDRTLWQLSKYQKYNDPRKELAANPKKLNAYNRLLAKQKGLEIELGRLQKELELNSASIDAQENPSTFHNSFVAMKTSLPDKQEIVAIVDEVNDAIFELGKKQAAVKSKKDDYTGWLSCEKCHSTITAKWQQTKHAKAYATLVQKNRQFDLNCVACHVTGILPAEAGKALRLPKVRQMVGCESCHGAGGKHVAAPEKFKLKVLPKEKVCLICHTAAHDNDFDYERDKQLVH